MGQLESFIQQNFKNTVTFNITKVVKTTDERLVFFEGSSGSERAVVTCSAKDNIYVDYNEGYWYLVGDNGMLFKFGLSLLTDLNGRPYTAIELNGFTLGEYLEKVEDAYNWLVNNILLGCCPSGGSGSSNVVFVANEASLPVTGVVGTLYITEDGSGIFIWNGTSYSDLSFIGQSAGGDLTGTYPNPTVHRVHGVDIQSGTPSNNDVWIYKVSANRWQHQPIQASEVNNDSSVTGVTVENALEHLDATKEPTITAGTTAQYYRGDKTFQTLNKAAVGLSNVDNTSDLNKPISTATQTALNGKENSLGSGTTSQYLRGDKTWQNLPTPIYLEVVRAGAAVPSPSGTTRFMTEGFAGLNTTLITTICPQKNFTTFRVFISSAQPSTGNLIIRRIFYNVAGTVQATQELIIPANSVAGIYTFTGASYDAAALDGSYGFTLINNASASSGTVNSIESVYQ